MEFWKKPFSAEIVSSETGLTLKQVTRVLGKMKKMGMVKKIATDGKLAIYVQELNYVEENPVNNYDYELDFLNAMIKKLKTANYSSTRQLEEVLNADRRKVTRYLTALCSIGMVKLIDGRYKIVKKVDLLLIGSKFDKNILTKMRDEQEGVVMARKEKVLKDASGREYPAKILDPQIVKRDTLVSRVMGRAERLHDKIAYEKDKMAADIDKYLQKTAEQYGEKWKGNAERNRERIDFDEKLQVAKQKIDECLKRWTEDSNVNLQAVINEAFQVDKKGEIAKHRILALRKYNIKDKNWKQAMDIIDEAIQVTSTKQYIAFYKRKSPNKPFELISLNFSAI
jgi:predicted transcriptional regulator